MGQIEVYEYLMVQRKLRPMKFFSVNEVCIGLKAQGCNGSTQRHLVGLHCAKLEADGYLEVVKPGKNNRWRRLFRLKKKYCRSLKC